MMVEIVPQPTYQGCLDDGQNHSRVKVSKRSRRWLKSILGRVAEEVSMMAKVISKLTCQGHLGYGQDRPWAKLHGRSQC